MMGGTEALLKKARESYAKGEYRWVAEVVHYAVFADPKNEAARDLQADALEQLGSPAESWPWRNFYLTSATAFPEGVQKLPVPDPASSANLLAHPLDMTLDYFSVSMNSEQ